MYGHISYIIIHVYEYLCVFMYVCLCMFIHIYIYSCMKNREVFKMISILYA